MVIHTWHVALPAAWRCATSRVLLFMASKFQINPDHYRTLGVNKTCFIFRKKIAHFFDSPGLTEGLRVAAQHIDLTAPLTSETS
jgi:hypothetical protein